VLRNDDLSLDDEVERVIQLMTDDAGRT
jgi:hypothetical protein